MFSNGDWILWAAMVTVWAASFIYSETPLNDTVWCFWRRLAGLNCFGCGLTRSFMAVSEGQLVDAVGFHPTGPLLYGAMVWYVIITMVRAGTGRPTFLRLPPRAVTAYWIVVGVVFCAHAANVIKDWVV